MRAILTFLALTALSRSLLVMCALSEKKVNRKREGRKIQIPKRS